MTKQEVEALQDRHKRVCQLGECAVCRVVDALLEAMEALRKDEFDEAQELVRQFYGEETR